MATRDLKAPAAQRGYAVGPPKFFMVTATAFFAVVCCHQFYEIHIVLGGGLILAAFPACRYHWRPPVPKRKKTAREMTTEELARDVFPKKVVEAVKKLSLEPEKDKKPSHSYDNISKD